MTVVSENGVTVFMGQALIEYSVVISFDSAWCISAFYHRCWWSFGQQCNVDGFDFGNYVGSSLENSFWLYFGYILYDMRGQIVCMLQAIIDFFLIKEVFYGVIVIFYELWRGLDSMNSVRDYLQFYFITNRSISYLTVSGIEFHY